MTSGLVQSGIASGVKRRNARIVSEARKNAPREQVKEVLTNVLYIQGLRALARIGGGERFGQRAEVAQAALIRDCWDEQAGLFWDLAGDDDRPLRVNTWSSLAPLCLEGLPEEIGKRLVEHLLDPSEYATPVPIASVAASEPSFVRPRTTRSAPGEGRSMTSG